MSPVKVLFGARNPIKTLADAKKQLTFNSNGRSQQEIRNDIEKVDSALAELASVGTRLDELNHQVTCLEGEQTAARAGHLPVEYPVIDAPFLRRSAELKSEITTVKMAQAVELEVLQRRRQQLLQEPCRLPLDDRAPRIKADIFLLTKLAFRDWGFSLFPQFVCFEPNSQQGFLLKAKGIREQTSNFNFTSVSTGKNRCYAELLEVEPNIPELKTYAEETMLLYAHNAAYGIRGEGERLGNNMRWTYHWEQDFVLGARFCGSVPAAVRQTIDELQAKVDQMVIVTAAPKLRMDKIVDVSPGECLLLARVGEIWWLIESFETTAATA